VLYGFWQGASLVLADPVPLRAFLPLLHPPRIRRARHLPPITPPMSRCRTAQSSLRYHVSCKRRRRMTLCTILPVPPNATPTRSSRAISVLRYTSEN
jgi:hypothetical protein